MKWDRRPRPRLEAATRLILSTLLGAAACARGADERSLSPGGLMGAELTPPLPKPEFVLTATDGRPFDFRRMTDGHLTLLYFGYTHCPDVCPVQMSVIAAVLQRMPDDLARSIRVVFVTTDPERDSPGRLRQWLDAFDPSFIGLTGTAQQLEQAQIAARLAPAERDTASGGEYQVGHAAQVIAYTPDNLGRAMYPFGFRQADWAHDLPRLARMGRAP